LISKPSGAGAARGAFFLISTVAVLALASVHRNTSLPRLTSNPEPTPRIPRLGLAGSFSRMVAHLTRRAAVASLFAVLVLSAAAAIPALAALPQGQELLRNDLSFSSIAATGVRPRPLAQIQLLRIASARAAEEAVPEQQVVDPEPPPAPTPDPPPEPAPEPSPEPPPPEPPAPPEPAPPAPAPQPVPTGEGLLIPGARVTFYACVGDGFCGNMASGSPVFDGAAACSNDLAMGTRFSIVTDPTGRVYQCLDRGHLAPTWVDVWFYDVASGWPWQSAVGAWSDIIVYP
jgi:hypothetical protein